MYPHLRACEKLWREGQVPLLVLAGAVALEVSPFPHPKNTTLFCHPFHLAVSILAACVLLPKASSLCQQLCSKPAAFAAHPSLFIDWSRLWPPVE